MSKSIKAHLKTSREFIAQTRQGLAGYLLEHLHSIEPSRLRHLTSHNLANDIQSLYADTGNLRLQLAPDPEVYGRAFAACEWLVIHEFVESRPGGGLAFTDKGQTVNTAAKFQIYFRQGNEAIDDGEPDLSLQGLGSSNSPEQLESILGAVDRPILGHVLFMDIVGHTLAGMTHQRDVTEGLKAAVAGTREFRRARSGSQLVSLPTGDGMALVFFDSPETPVYCAIELSKALKSMPEINLRIGIHSGLVHRVADINANSNVSGPGINLAQRVMDCGDAGHILLSRTVAEMLAPTGDWSDRLHDLGEVEVKHGARIHAFNFFDHEVGNSTLPHKFTANEAVPKLGQVEAAVQTARGHSDLEGYPGVELAKVWRTTVINRLIPLAETQAVSLATFPRYWDALNLRPINFSVLLDEVRIGANLTQFLEGYPELQDMLSTQSQQVNGLHACIKRLHEELTSEEICVSIKSILLSSGGSDDSWDQLLDRLHIDEHLMLSALAGYIINQSTEIGGDVLSEIWQKHRTDFLSLRKHEKILRYCDDLSDIGGRLIVLDRMISDLLKAIRAELGRRWKISYE
jgi:class 3 adenylate cyclase